VLWAQGPCGFSGIAGYGRHGLREDDNTAGLETMWVDGIASSRMARGAQRSGLGEDDVVAGSGTALHTWGRHLRGRRHRRLGSGKMAVHKGLDRGRDRRCRSFGEESTMVQAQAPGRSTTVRALRKFSAGNFGSLTV
jgi:hypothetical protein